MATEPTPDVNTPEQGWIDATIYGTGPQEVLLSEGVTTLADTLHVGHGTTNGTFTTVRVKGAGLNFMADGGSFKGTTLICGFNDRPGINIQGARNSVVSDLSVKGINRDYLYLTLLGTGQIGYKGTLDCLEPETWCGPALTSNPIYNSQTAPNAGVTIDAYTGVRPAKSYPDVNYPPEAGSTDQWGKAMSSAVSLRDVGVYGFYVGLCTDPSGGDGNGDFLHCRDSAFVANVYAVAVTHTQARITGFERCSFAMCHTILDTVTFGMGAGGAGMSFNGCDFGCNVRMFNVGTAYAGPVAFNECYGELVYMLGNVGGWAAGNLPVVLTNCQIGFGDMGEIGIPAWMATGGANAGVVLRGGVYQFQDVAIFQCHVVCDYAQVTNETVLKAIETKTDTLAMRKAHNLCLGILPHPVNLHETEQMKVGSSVYFLDVGSPGRNNYLTYWPGAFTPGGRGKTIPWMARELQVPYSGRVGTPHPNPKPHVTPFGKDAAQTYADFTGFNIATGKGAIRLRSLLPHQPGDILIDDQTGTVLRVESSLSSGEWCTDTVVPLNNLKGMNRDTLRTKMTVDGGNIWLLRSGIYTTSVPLYGDFIQGSPVITNVSRGDGAAWFIESDIGVGDFLLLGSQDGHYCAGGIRWCSEIAQVTVRSNPSGPSPGIIEMSVPAWRSGAKVPIGFFMRNDQ